MKKYFLVVFFALLTTLSFAQTKTAWKELDDFHAIVAPVFHTAEKGNYNAAKDSATLVLKRAELWQAAPIPATLDAAVFKPLIDRLVLECKAINVTVTARKPDDELKLVLRKAHNTFHEILAKYNQSVNKTKS